MLLYLLEIKFKIKFYHKNIQIISISEISLRIRISKSFIPLIFVFFLGLFKINCNKLKTNKKWLFKATSFIETLIRVRVYKILLYFPDI